MEEPKMNKHDILDDEQIKKLRSLGITRNIKNLYDLECWLLMFIEVHNTKFYLKLETLSISCSRKSIKTEELDTIKNTTPNRIYYRYNYINLEYLSEYGEKIYHLSKIDAIIYVMEVIINNSEKPNGILYKNIVNQSDLGEFYNSKKFNELDGFKQITSLEREYQNKFITFTNSYGLLYPYIIKTYQFTSLKNWVFMHFMYECEETKYTRFNLYQITEKNLKEYRNVFKQLFETFENRYNNTKYHDKDAQEMKRIIYCTSGMNIYYIDYGLYCSYRLNILSDENK